VGLLKTDPEKSMRILAKILLSSIFFFVSAASHASHIDNSEKASQVFFQLLEDYPSALYIAIEAGDVSKMSGVVELDSPWYKFLEFTKEHNDFIFPRFCGGIRICSLPYLPFLMAKSQFVKNIHAVKITQNQSQKEIYSFSIQDTEIIVSYKDSVMKLYRLISPEINAFYGRDILEKFFL